MLGVSLREQAGAGISWPGLHPTMSRDSDWFLAFLTPLENQL